MVRNTVGVRKASSGLWRFLVQKTSQCRQTCVESMSASVGVVMTFVQPCPLMPVPDGLLVHKGTTNIWQAGVTIPTVDEKLILSAWKWYLALTAGDPEVAKGTYVLVEVMQKVHEPRAFHEVVLYLTRHRLRTSLLASQAKLQHGLIPPTSTTSSLVLEFSQGPRRRMHWHTRQWQRGLMRFDQNTPGPTTSPTFPSHLWTSRR